MLELLSQVFEDDDDLAYATTTDEDSKKPALEDGRPSWMRTLHSSLSQWMHLIPKVQSCLYTACCKSVMIIFYYVNVFIIIFNIIYV